MDLYVNAVRSANRIRRVCLNNRHNAEKMYDTVLDDDDRWSFYRGLEDIVETAKEVGGNGRFFMGLIRTLEILYIQDYYHPNADGLVEFYRAQTNGTNQYHMPVDLLNLTNALISKDPEYNRQVEADILVVVLMA
jgi:hypothetical protein